MVTTAKNEMINETITETFINETTWTTGIMDQTSEVFNCTSNVCQNTTGVPEAAPLTTIKVLEYINYGLLPMFLLLGLTGNTLTVITMQTKRYSHLTSRFFLVSLALSDTVLLLTQPFNKSFVLSFLGKDFRALSNVGCKAFFVIFKTAKMSSSWFLVFICCERFVAVWFPLKAKLICTKRVALTGVITVYTFIGSYTSVWSYASQITSSGICHPDVYDKSNPDEVSQFGTFLLSGLAIYSIIPICFLSIITPLIIIKLSRQSMIRRRMTIKSKKDNSSQESRTTVMLVGVMVAYIVLISPVTALHMSAFFLRLNAFGKNSVEFVIFKEVSQILEQMNYAVNFYLYVLTSSMFRKGLYDIFSCKKDRILGRSSSTDRSTSGHSTSMRRKKYEEPDRIRRPNEFDSESVCSDRSSSMRSKQRNDHNVQQIRPDTPNVMRQTSVSRKQRDGNGTPPCNYPSVSTKQQETKMNIYSISN